MRMTRSYFKLEAIWILAFSLAPLLIGLLIALVLGALR
jgi:hypothetical protein